jgi:hypothetical protein
MRARRRLPLLPVSLLAILVLGSCANPQASWPAPRSGASPSSEPTASFASRAPGSAEPLAEGSSLPARTPSAPAERSLAPTPGPTVAVTTQPTSAPIPPAPATPLPIPTDVPTAAPTAAPTPAPVADCGVFPASNVWNRPVTSLPVRSDSAALIASIGLDAVLHPDFSASGYGIPINVVSPSTPLSAVSFQYADESDAGPYPIPATPAIEGGSDRHLIMWDRTSCYLYELYAASRSGGAWHAGSGAIWNLQSNQLRPDGWTSADAAGLPILPGLVRYDEVAAGAIRHAIRFTAPQTRSAHIYPARHDAGAGNGANLPPMGLRVRLKGSVDISRFGPQARVILAALQTYGMILADNGSPWYITGAPDPHWNDDQLHALQQLTGADFEVVDTSSLRNG